MFIATFNTLYDVYIPINNVKSIEKRSDVTMDNQKFVKKYQWEEYIVQYLQSPTNIYCNLQEFKTYKNKLAVLYVNQNGCILSQNLKKEKPRIIWNKLLMIFLTRGEDSQQSVKWE